MVRFEFEGLEGFVRDVKGPLADQLVLFNYVLVLLEIKYLLHLVV